MTQKLFQCLEFLGIYYVPLFLYSFGILNTQTLFNRFILASITVGMLLYLLLINISSSRWRQFNIIGNWKQSLWYNIWIMGCIALTYVLYYSIQNPSLRNYRTDFRGFPDIAFVLFYFSIGILITNLVFWGDLRFRLQQLGMPAWMHYAIVPILFYLTHQFFPSETIYHIAHIPLALAGVWIQNHTDSMIGNIVTQYIFVFGAFTLGLA